MTSREGAGGVWEREVLSSIKVGIGACTKMEGFEVLNVYKGLYRII